MDRSWLCHLAKLVGTGEELQPTITLDSSEVTYMDRMGEQASWGSGSSLEGMVTLS